MQTILLLYILNALHPLPVGVIVFVWVWEILKAMLYIAGIINKAVKN